MVKVILAHINMGSVQQSYAAPTRKGVRSARGQMEREKIFFSSRLFFCNGMALHCLHKYMLRTRKIF